MSDLVAELLNRDEDFRRIAHGDFNPSIHKRAADRITAIEAQLVTDFNTMNQHGAKQDETIRELMLQRGMANHAEDVARAENAELVAANTLLMVRLEKARVIIEGFQISHFRRDPEGCSCINCTLARAWLTGKDE